MIKIYKEITPLTVNDCFTVFDRHKTKFDFPLHYHDEYELNFIENAAGAQRIVGDSVEEIHDLELVLVGSNVPHGWFNHNCTSTNIHEITIQFHKDLFDDNFLKRNQMQLINSLLQNSSRGISFSKEAINKVKYRLLNLRQNLGFESFLELQAILHELSLSSNKQSLGSLIFQKNSSHFENNKIDDTFNYIRQNYKDDITLEQMAQNVNMTVITFSRFLKKQTGKTFTQILIDIRLGHATRLLNETKLNIFEICYKSGFKNQSYFNRVFKHKHKVSPNEFREIFAKSRTFF